MLKVKEGDKVVVKVTSKSKHVWVDSMLEFNGKEVVVDEVDNVHNYIRCTNFWWWRFEDITHVNGVPLQKGLPYENWKMSISKDKFVRCITPLGDDCTFIEDIYGYLDKVHDKFYYNVYDGMDKYIVADVYATDRGYEFVRENKDSGKVSGVEENSDIMDAVTATKEGILASFGLPTDIPTYNPVKNISRNKFLRCVSMCKEKVVFNNLDGSNTYWMDKSPCGGYYYWDGYNRNNKVIYFRGEVDWVERNYRRDNPEQRKLFDLADSLRGAITEIGNDEKDPVIVSSENCEAIKSDGGKSDYYKITLTDWIIDKQKENGYIMLEDLAEIIFDNDFNFTNVFKAQKRMFELKKGRGKAGNDFEYDAKKCHYYVDKQVEVEGRK